MLLSHRWVLNCRLDTQVCDSNWAWSLTQPLSTVIVHFLPRWGRVLERVVVGGGTQVQHSFNSSRLSDESLVQYSWCHFVPTVRIQPVEKLSLCSLFAVTTVLSVQSHCAPLHTLVGFICILPHVTGLHYSPVSRDDSVPHLYFQPSSALQRNIRSLTCIDYCFYFQLKSNRLMFFGEKNWIKCDLMLNSWVIWWLARKHVDACCALNRLNASASGGEWCFVIVDNKI